MNGKSLRGLLIGLALAGAVFVAGGANFAASQDAVVPAQWMVGGDDKWAGEADDYVIGTLDAPTGESVADDAPDFPPAG